MSLPIFQTNSKDISLLQTSWASQLNQLLAMPTNHGLILNNIELVPGSNVVNHKLGRKLQGWSVVRMKNAFVQIFDTQDTNQQSNLTLTLNSSGPGLIDLFVF